MKKATSPEARNEAVSGSGAAFWTALYAITQHWKRDVEFFEDELSFLRLLVDKHLAVLIEPRNIEQTRSMVSHLIGLENDRTTLAQKLAGHSKDLAECLHAPFSQDTDKRREGHAKLEDEVALFLKRMHEVKSEVFKLTEKVIHSEKVRKMIDWA